MRDHFAPDGRLITYHMSKFPYIAAKIAGIMTDAFGHPPLVFHLADYRLFNYTYVIGPHWTPPADSGEARLPADVALPHDNWPYLYLRRHVVPPDPVRGFVRLTRARVRPARAPAAVARPGRPVGAGRRHGGPAGVLLVLDLRGPVPRPSGGLARPGFARL